MTQILMVLAGSGLVGCFGFALRLDLSQRGGRARRRLARPRSSALVYEREAAI